MKNLELYKWQEEALQAWKDNNYQGVIEAVTGSGKTRVAHKAILTHLPLGYKICILVPSVDLQRQWYDDLKKIICVYEYDITLLGGGSDWSSVIAHNWRVLIAVVKSASNRELFPGKKALLIADECHHYGAPAFQAALKEDFSRRLGLTATYERSDDGLERFLNPYFTKVCYQLNYEKALQEGVIAHFKLAFIRVSLSEDERYGYKLSEDQCKIYKTELVKRGVTEEPFGIFMKEVAKLCNGFFRNTRLSKTDERIGLAKSYLHFFAEKRALLANASQKFRILSRLSSIIKEADRTILFSQTKESAQKAVAVLKNNSINANVINSDMNKWERKEILADFEEGDTEAVAAPILLDEGINVPSADLAIILSSNRNKRQMIQRMGRVIRIKEDGRLARIVILVAENTFEDPELGAHEAFLEDIIEVADDIQYFDEDDIQKITEYLNTY